MVCGPAVTASYDRGRVPYPPAGFRLAFHPGPVAALVVVGFAAHSLAVLAAGARTTSRTPPSACHCRRSGSPHIRAATPRAATVAALVNAGWLLILNIAIIVTAIQHLAAGAHHAEGLPVLIVSAIAAAVMLAGAPILGGDADDDGTEDLNVKAVLLDTAAAAGVAVSGAIIFCTGLTGPPRCHRGDHRLPRAEAHP